MASFLVCGLTACDRGSTSSQPASPAAPSEDRVTLPAQKPEYSFAAGLADKYPQVVGFMQHFLETCLAGDYSGYRRLVARATDPESRARFERILHALRSLDVESIEEVEIRRIPPPVYLVIGKADFVADEQAARHRRSGPRRVGILVLQEDSEWRMTLAPAELQPADEELDESTSAPTTTSAPSYPWDQDSDY